jgi:hypothetical protein
MAQHHRCTIKYNIARIKMTQTWNCEVSEVKVSVPKPQIMKKFIERIHKALHFQNIGIK